MHGCKEVSALIRQPLQLPASLPAGRGSILNPTDTTLAIAAPGKLFASPYWPEAMVEDKKIYANYWDFLS